jgi:hypothetical protein
MPHRYRSMTKHSHIVNSDQAALNTALPGSAHTSKNKADRYASRRSRSALSAISVSSASGHYGQRLR